MSKSRKRRSRGRKRNFFGGSRRRRKANPLVARSSHRRVRRFGAHRRRRNPVNVLGMAPTDYLKLGAGVAVGTFGTKAIPQLVLNAKNTGPLGYAAMAISTLGLTYVAQKFVSREMALGVAGGGTAAILLRLWQENVAKTSPAADATMTGLGDPDMSASGLGMYVEGLQNSQGTGGPYLTASSVKGLPAATAAAAGAINVPIQSRFKRFDA